MVIALDTSITILGYHLILLVCIIENSKNLSSWIDKIILHIKLVEPRIVVAPRICPKIYITHSLIIILFSQKFKLMKKCHFWSQRGKSGEIRSKRAILWLQNLKNFWSHLEPIFKKWRNSVKKGNFVAPMAPRWLQEFWSQSTKMPPLK